jgi:hypothetical protein
MSEGGLARCRGCLKHSRNFRHHISRHHRRNSCSDGDKMAANKQQLPTAETPAANTTAKETTSHGVKDDLHQVCKRKGKKLRAVAKQKNDSPVGDGKLPTRNPSPTPLKLKIKLGAGIVAAAELEKHAVQKSPPSVAGNAIGGDRKKGAEAVVTPADDPPLVESLGIDVPSQQDLLTRNHLGHRNRHALRSGATVPPPPPPAALPPDHAHRCGVCRAKFTQRADFTAHILGHRSVGGGGGDDDAIHQCEDCGACFASAASWGRHRLLIHRMREEAEEEFGQDFSDEEEEQEQEQCCRLIVGC